MVNFDGQMNQKIYEIFGEHKISLGLTRAKQVGLEHAKRNSGVSPGSRTTTPPLPPPLGISMVTDTMVLFFDGFPKKLAFKFSTFH